MALLSDFCGETANNPGTSTTVTLTGPINGSIRTFAQTYATGSRTFYEMTDETAQREIGLGTFTAGSPDTVSRDTVLANTSGNQTRLNFTGGIFIYNTLPSANAIYKDELGRVRLAAAMIDTAMTGWGNSRLIAGSPTQPGYLELTDVAGTRTGYVGSSLGTRSVLGKGGTFTGWYVDGDLVVNAGATVNGGFTVTSGSASVGGTGQLSTAGGNINSGARVRATTGAINSGDPFACPILGDFFNFDSGSSHATQQPNGVILQNGNAAPPTGNGDVVTFPTAFPVACTYVNVRVTGDVSTIPVAHSIITSTKNNFTIRVVRWNGSAYVNAGGIGLRWFAMGY